MAYSARDISRLYGIAYDISAYQATYLRRNGHKIIRKFGDRNETRIRLFFNAFVSNGISPASAQKELDCIIQEHDDELMAAQMKVDAAEQATLWEKIKGDGTR